MVFKVKHIVVYQKKKVKHIVYALGFSIFKTCYEFNVIHALRT